MNSEQANLLDEVFGPTPDVDVNQPTPPPAPPQPPQVAVEVSAQANSADNSEEELDPDNQNPLDGLAMDEPIFFGGPTRAAIEDMKKTYAHSKLYVLLLNDNTGIVYRTITRGEWKSIQSQMQNIGEAEKREEFIFSKITLFPVCKDGSEVENLPAGAVNSVMQEFYTYCGFTPVSASLRL